MKFTTVGHDVRLEPKEPTPRRGALTHHQTVLINSEQEIDLNCDNEISLN